MFSFFIYHSKFCFWLYFDIKLLAQANKFKQHTLPKSTYLTPLLAEVNIFLKHGLVVKGLDSQSRGPVLKPPGGSKVDSASHPSEVDQISNRNFWELSDKK